MGTVQQVVVQCYAAVDELAVFIFHVLDVRKLVLDAR
jgi:hypothetical protein